MKAIGGYFELEIPAVKNNYIHSECVFLNSGRHALEYILRSLGNKVRKVWLPYYTCDVVFQPLIRLGIKQEFYQIDKNLEIATLPVLQDFDYIIVNNYFGIKDKYIKELAVYFGDHLIVDNAQAWYAPEFPGIFSFYSPRKFFGLPDGGLASVPEIVPADFDKDTSYDRFSHLLKRIDLGSEAGYMDFRRNSLDLSKLPLRKMSLLTQRILSSIDFESVRLTRRSNYAKLSEILNDSNLLKLPFPDTFACPMVYPYLTEDVGLRQKLIDNKVFVATYWPNVVDMCDQSSCENYLSKNIIPLPIDQRYTISDMELIINIIRNDSI